MKRGYNWKIYTIVCIIFLLIYLFLSNVSKIFDIIRWVFVIPSLYLILGLFTAPLFKLFNKNFPISKWYFSLGRFFLGLILIVVITTILTINPNNNPVSTTHTVGYLLMPLVDFNLGVALAGLIFFLGLILILLHFYDLVKLHRNGYFLSKIKM